MLIHAAFIAIDYLLGEERETLARVDKISVDGEIIEKRGASRAPFQRCFDLPYHRFHNRLAERMEEIEDGLIIREFIRSGIRVDDLWFDASRVQRLKLCGILPGHVA